jgi:hypothetical protein
MRRFCVLVVVAVALGAAAVPSSASAAVVDQCSAGADFSIGIPVPSGAVPPAAPFNPGLSSGPSCTIVVQSVACASGCLVLGAFGGTGVVAGRIQIFAANQSSTAECGPALNTCEVSRQFAASSAFISCRVSGVVAALTGVNCQVRTL